MKWILFSYTYYCGYLLKRITESNCVSTFRTAALAKQHIKLNEVWEKHLRTKRLRTLPFSLLAGKPAPAIAWASGPSQKLHYTRRHPRIWCSLKATLLTVDGHFINASLCVQDLKPVSITYARTSHMKSFSGGPRGILLIKDYSELRWGRWWVFPDRAVPFLSALSLLFLSTEVFFPLSSSFFKSHNFFPLCTSTGRELQVQPTVVQLTLTQLTEKTYHLVSYPSALTMKWQTRSWKQSRIIEKAQTENKTSFQSENNMKTLPNLCNSIDK